jgi:hypothetical protein
MPKAQVMALTCVKPPLSLPFPILVPRLTPILAMAWSLYHGVKLNLHDIYCAAAGAFVTSPWGEVPSSMTS